jgi:cell division protein FtsW
LIKLRSDYLLLLAVIILIACGTVMIYSASAIVADVKFKSTTFFLRKQLIWILLALPVLLIFSKLDYHKIKNFSLPVFLISFIFLIAVLFFEPTKGVKRWIRFGFFGFQPSEFFRYALTLFLASSLSRKVGKLKEFKHIAIPYFPIIGAAFILILLEPDLGTIFSILVCACFLFFVAGARLKHLFSIILPVTLAGIVFVFVLGYEKDRIDDYLGSFWNPLNGSYQLKQSVISLGNGGFGGVGLGEGKQKLFFLPEPHTDFILATVGEETGFLGIGVILFLFLILAWRGVLIAAQAPDLFGFFLAFGITLTIFICALINAGVVVGLLPTTGIPLPFLSYGGSSLLVAIAGVGILLNISRQIKERNPYPLIKNFKV